MITKQVARLSLFSFYTLIVTVSRPRRYETSLNLSTCKKNDSHEINLSYIQKRRHVVYHYIIFRYFWVYFLSQFTGMLPFWGVLSHSEQQQQKHFNFCYNVYLIKFFVLLQKNQEILKMFLDSVFAYNAMVKINLILMNRIWVDLIFHSYNF